MRTPYRFVAVHPPQPEDPTSTLPLTRTEFLSLYRSLCRCLPSHPNPTVTDNRKSLLYAALESSLESIRVRRQQPEPVIPPEVESAARIAQAKREPASEEWPTALPSRLLIFRVAR